MFDCGLAATHKLVKAGLFPTQVDHLFFTHHHFDHDVDYPAFLLTRWDQSIYREWTLRVFGPAPTERLTRGILDEREGIRPRLDRAREPSAEPERLPAARGVLPDRRRSWRARRRTRSHRDRPRLGCDRGARGARPAVARLARLPPRLARRVGSGDRGHRPCASVVELARGGRHGVPACSSRRTSTGRRKPTPCVGARPPPEWPRRRGRRRWCSSTRARASKRPGTWSAPCGTWGTRFTAASCGRPS